MSYKKREIKTDEDSVAEFWNQLEVDDRIIKKAFHYHFRRFPSENMTDSMHDLIMEFHRLETFKNFDPTRSKSTSTRNRYEVYLFNQVQKVLSYAYSRRRVDYGREVKNEDHIQNYAFEDNDIIRNVEYNRFLGSLKEHLSDKHYELIELVLKGFNNTEIAEVMGVSSTMVGVYLKTIRQQITRIPGMSDTLSQYLKEAVHA